MLPIAKLLAFLCILVLGSGMGAHATASQKPAGLVDLGHAKHVPTFYTKTASGNKISVYKNIRFANPPTGDLRFRLPDTRLPKVDGIQDGNTLDERSTHCISSAPAAVPFPPYNGTTWGHEDCLFLDVWVPEGVQPGDKLPVLHWFIGGAYAFGSKEMFVSPHGLFDIMGRGTKFIYVASNYRLGLAGWTYLPGEDLVANLGMHDCLAAAEWTSKFISRFGGDPERITAMGVSAGAGIIGLLTVLNGGKGKLPFQQAVLLSPDIPPRRNPIRRQKRLFQTILDEANCTSLECLRRAPESTMLYLNDRLINGASSDAGGGVFGPAPGFGPVVDGRFIPDIPVALFRQGKYHKELRSLVIGNTANEGMGTSHDEGLPDYFPVMVRQILSTASNDTIAHIQSHYDFAEEPAKLAWDWTTDIIFACNAANIATAYKDRARRYIFSLPPAIHGQDLFHLFYSNQTMTPVEDMNAARTFQRNLLRFLHGYELPWPVYGAGKRITNITTGGFEDILLAADLRARCEMVNRVVLDPRNGV
ncbi:Carboxylic ester hydrolase [Madurella fahalii]|uniref:Carboxylic ester hydrolase n=1 Tax=Madurella fahalii TaxID=1157608 RepID=A0ABQ0GGS5_9PEZI